MYRIEKLMEFCQSDIIRFLFLMIDDALTTLVKEVPCFADWKKVGGLIDFSGDINAQLNTLVKLTKSESSYIANTIRTLGDSRHRKAVLNP